MARLGIANPFLAICVAASALLPVACGPGASAAPAGDDPAGAAPREWAPPLEAFPGSPLWEGPERMPESREERVVAGLRLLVRARGELAGVRRALSAGAPESAGTSLARTILDLEEGMALAGARLTPRAAAELEAARRSADRWRAGVAPEEEAAERIVRLMEDESETLAKALDPR